MAVKQNPTHHFTILFLSLALLFTPIVSRENHITQIETVLNVKASLKLTNLVLSLKPDSFDSLSQSQTQITQSNDSSTFFSLPLHPRRSSGHETYRSLLLARLARDATRVDSVNARLGLAIEGVKRSELRPDSEESILPESAVSTPVVSGTNEGSGEYFTRVGVGSPARQFSMVIDTGSDVNWLQCNPCSDCYRQSDPVFDPATSSSFSRLSCSSPQCSALDTSGCRANACLYQVAYGDGSYTVGDFVTETISFGTPGSAKSVALGCGHDNEGLFVGAAGLVGLGGGELSLTNQIKATSFSYCLVNRDSSATSTLDFNSAAPSDSVLAPILRNRKLDTFYYVKIDGISVGGRLIPAAADASVFAIDNSGNGGIIVDSGTAVTRLRAPVYESLRDSFRALTRDLPLLAEPVALFDTCYDLSSRTSVRVPTVSFRLSGGKVWQLPARNYLIPVDNAGTFCLAFAPTKSSLSIIGNVQQQGTRVSYDLASNVVGFSPNKC